MRFLQQPTLLRDDPPHSSAQINCEWCEVMKPSRMSKFYTGIYASLEAYLLFVQRATSATIIQSCSCSELKQDTGFVLAVDSTFWPTLCFRLQTAGRSCHLMSQYASRAFFMFYYLGRNYSLLGVKQEAVCAADACLFGFHVSMATGTYQPCVITAFFTRFYSQKEQRV